MPTLSKDSTQSHGILVCSLEQKLGPCFMLLIPYVKIFKNNEL